MCRITRSSRFIILPASILDVTFGYSRHKVHSYLILCTTGNKEEYRIKQDLTLVAVFLEVRGFLNCKKPVCLTIFEQ